MLRYVLPILILITAMGCGGPSRPGGDPGAKPDGPPPGPPPVMNEAQRLEHTMDVLTKRLELKPEQVPQVRAIIKAGEAKKASMAPEGDRWDSPKAMAKFYDDLRKVDQDTETSLAKVLTSSQMDEYLDYQEELRDRIGKKNDGKGRKLRTLGVPPSNRPPGTDL